MSTLRHAFVWLAVLHFIMLMGVAVWAFGTNRINADRITNVKDIFALTIDDELKQEELAQQQVEQEKSQIEETARRNGTGPAPIAERLEDENLRNELTMRKLDRKEKDIKILQRNLFLARQLMDSQKEDIEKIRQELDTRLKDTQTQLNDEGFQKTVTLFEGLPAKQTKQMFMHLITGNQTEQVVAYLEAMKPRKATSILKEFKTPEEITAVVELTERLRERGSDLVTQVENVG